MDGEKSPMGEAMDTAKMALLEQIKNATGGASPLMLLQLAEAYAWTTSPHQSHGGGAAPKTS